MHLYGGIHEGGGARPPSGRTSARGGYDSGRAQQNVYTTAVRSGEAVVRVDFCRRQHPDHLEVLAGRKRDEAPLRDEATLRNDAALRNEATLRNKVALRDDANQNKEASLHDEAGLRDEAVLHSVCPPSGRTSALGGYGSGRAQQNVYTRI